MLYYNSELKWEDSKKDNILIDFYYNMENLRRYIKTNKKAITDSATPIKKSIFNIKQSDDKEVLLQNENLDIFASKWRSILQKYDPNNIDNVSDMLTLISEFTDFILFLDKIHTNRDITGIEAKEENDTKYINIYSVEVYIQSSVIPKPSKSGSIILDMIDGSSEDDKYVSIYKISKFDHTYKFISGDCNPTFRTVEEKILFVKATDIILNEMYNYMKDIFIGMISLYTGYGNNKLSFYTDDDSKIISENLARGIIYVRK